MALRNWVGLNDVIGVEAGSSVGCLLGCLLVEDKYPQVCEFSKYDYGKACVLTA